MSRTDGDARIVTALSSLDGLNRFAGHFNLSIRKTIAASVPWHPKTFDGSYSEFVSHNLEPPQNNWNKTEVEEVLASVRDVPFTDSGYASVPCITEDSKPMTLTDTTDDESKTVYSVATTAVPSLAHKSISEVCKDIHTKITRQMANMNWASVSHTVPSLIKAFAIKLGSGTSSDNDRRIMHFVHQHHQ